MDASNRSCFTRISANMATVVPTFAKSIYDNIASPAFGKVSALSKKYLLPKVKNTIKSKVLPFSASADLQRKKTNTKKNIARLKGLVNVTKMQKDTLENQTHFMRPDIQRKNSPIMTSTDNALDKLEKLEKINKEFEKKLELAQAYNIHLSTLQKSEVFSRLAGYVGMVAAEAFAMSEMLPVGFIVSVDFIPKEILDYIPNPTNFAVSQLVQAVAITMQLRGAFKLPEAALKDTCIYEARKRILTATASVFCILAMNYIKQNRCIEASPFPKWGCPKPPMLLASNSSLY